jgi:hypothetical protein
MLLWALVGLSAWIIVALILGTIFGRAARLGEPSQESLVLDCLAAGMTVEEIVAEYPTVDPAEGARGRRLRSAVGVERAVPPPPTGADQARQPAAYCGDRAS